MVEATARGLQFTAMIGILPDRRGSLSDYRSIRAWTAMAIGYRADPTQLPEALRERDLTPRQRKRLSKFVFTGQWGHPSSIGLNLWTPDLEPRRRNRG